MKNLDGGAGYCCSGSGSGEGAVEEAIKYTKERMQFRAESAFLVAQNTQFQLAEMHTNIRYFLVYNAAMKKRIMSLLFHRSCG